MILRDNVQNLKGSLLLNALFEYEWKAQKAQIGKIIFLPFILFFFISNLYYTQYMFAPVHHIGYQHRGIWGWLCEDDTVQCEYHDESIFYMRILFGGFLLWMAFIEIY